MKNKLTLEERIIILEEKVKRNNKEYDTDEVIYININDDYYDDKFIPDNEIQSSSMRVEYNDIYFQLSIRDETNIIKSIYSVLLNNENIIRGITLLLNNNVLEIYGLTHIKREGEFLPFLQSLILTYENHPIIFISES